MVDLSRGWASMLLIFALYLVGHLCIYLLLSRRLSIFRLERAILLYHAGPASVVMLAAAFYYLVLGGNSGGAPFVLILSAHGIYSLSFLELWSLAQGGYSISILTELARAERTGEAPDLDALTNIGTEKQAARLRGLMALGLLCADKATYRLTARGQVAAAALSAIRRLANLSDTG